MKKSLILSFVFLLMFSFSSFASELVYWSVWNEPEVQAQALKKIFADFEKENPGVKVKAVWNGRQSLVKLRSYLAAGKTIDLFDGDGDTFLGLVLKEDMTQDISSVAASLKGQLLPNTSELFLVNGKQYGLPYIHNSVMFFYSKEAFKKAGIKNTPDTWSEFLDACDALKKAGYNPLAIEGNVDFYQYYYAGYLFDRLAGKDFIVKAATDKTGETWRDPVVKQLLALEKELWDKGFIPEESKGYQWPAGQNDIAMGDTAMELVGSWLPTELGKSVAPGFEWGAFAFPKVPNGKNDMDIMLAVMTMGVYSQSKNVDKAKDLVEFILNAPNQKLMADMGKIGVVRKGIQWDKGIADAVSVIENSEGGFITDGVSTFHPEYASTILRPMHSKVFIGQITSEEFINGMVEKTKAYWAKK